MLKSPFGLQTLLQPACGILWGYTNILHGSQTGFPAGDLGSARFALRNLYESFCCHMTLQLLHFCTVAFCFELCPFSLEGGPEFTAIHINSGLVLFSFLFATGWNHKLFVQLYLQHFGAKISCFLSNLEQVFLVTCSTSELKSRVLFFFFFLHVGSSS